MSFDPAWPPHGAELESLPFRNQFNALKALIDQQAAQMAVLQAANLALQGRVEALEAQTPPSGALNVQSVTAGTVAASSGVFTVGRFSFQVDGNGNLQLFDTISGWNTQLSNIPI